MNQIRSGTSLTGKGNLPDRSGIGLGLPAVARIESDRCCSTDAASHAISTPAPGPSSVRISTAEQGSSTHASSCPQSSDSWGRQACSNMPPMHIAGTASTDQTMAAMAAIRLTVINRILSPRPISGNPDATYRTWRIRRCRIIYLIVTPANRLKCTTMSLSTFPNRDRKTEPRP